MWQNDLSGALSAEAIGALRNAKTSFFGAQADRCRYLRIGFEPHPEDDQLAVAAQFTLEPDREWHEANASISLSDLEGGDFAAIERAFETLAEKLRVAGIARHFRPQGFDA